MLDKIDRSAYLPVILLVIINMSGRIVAQDIRTELLEIKYLYEDLHFSDVIQAGHLLLDDVESIKDPAQLVFIHQYMGISFFQLNRIDSSRVHFLALLSIDPQKELDPLTTSPKIIKLFEQLKNDFKNLSNEKVYLPYPQYILLEDKRPGAAWRSAVLPGWGQYYKGQTSRAYLMGGAFTLSTLTLIVSAIEENSYRKKYLNSTDPEEISDDYHTYNSWSQLRQVSTYTTIGVWLLVFADALWMRAPESESGLSAAVSPGAISVSFYHTF